MSEEFTSQKMSANEFPLPSFLLSAQASAPIQNLFCFLLLCSSPILTTTPLVFLLYFFFVSLTLFLLLKSPHPTFCFSYFQRLLPLCPRKILVLFLISSSNLNTSFSKNRPSSIFSEIPIFSPCKNPLKTRIFLFPNPLHTSPNFVFSKRPIPSFKSHKCSSNFSKTHK